MLINRNLFFFIFLITISNFVFGQSTDENSINSKRITLFGQQLSNPFSSATPPVIPAQDVPIAPPPLAALPQPALLPASPQIGIPSLPLTPPPPPPAIPTLPTLPTYFTQDPRYQNKNDLLTILTLFTSKLNVEAITNELWHNSPTVETCIACNILVQHLKTEYKGDEPAFKKFFFTVCELFKINGDDNQEFCTGFTEIYAPQLFYILENTKLSSEEICASLLTDCLDHYHWYQQPLFWEIQLSEKIQQYNNESKILQYMTPRAENSNSSTVDSNVDNDELNKRTSLPAQPAQPAYNQAYVKPSYEEIFEGGRFLHLTDIHIDLLYSLHSTSYCGRIFCCRQEPMKKYPENLKLRTIDPSGSYHANMYYENKTLLQQQDLNLPAGFWGSYGGCDLPLRTVKHLLRHLTKYVDQLDYIVFSGDSISHNIWSTNKQQVIETNAILTKLITKYLLTPISTIKVDAYGNQYGNVNHLPPRRFIPVIGNHESDVVSMFPSTSLQYSRFSITWLYEELYKQWKQFIPVDQVSNFKKGGYYSVQMAKNLKLIILNTNACYRLNFWLLVFNQDLDDQLVWLEHELSVAEKSGIENVHLIGHIAPDQKDCNAVWLHNFIRIVTRYQAIIKAQFYGHSHLDEIKIYYGNNYADKNVVSRSENLDQMHKQHTEENVKSIIEEVKDENRPKSKRIVNILAEQQIKQLISLQSLQSQLLHLNKNLIYKTKISLNDKINGYYKDTSNGYIKKPISIAFLSPSLSAFDDVNPAYKVYVIDDNGYVQNGKTFFADIAEANNNHLINNYNPTTPVNHLRNIPSEDLDESNDDDEDESESRLSYSLALPDNEIEESENNISNSYALPNKNTYSSYNGYSSYPAYKTTTSTNYATSGNYKTSENGYAQSYADKKLTPTTYYSQQPASTAYQSEYNSKPVGNKKIKDYSESNYQQPKNYEKPASSYLPVYEKYSIQPQYTKSAKKYSTTQNSYESKNPQNTQYSLSAYSQPQLNYNSDSRKLYQQQPSYSKLNQNNYQNTYSMNNYKQPQYNQYKSKTDNKYSSQTANYSPVPNYADYNSMNAMKYSQLTADNYISINDLPGDIDYEYKHYDDINDDKTSKQINYQPIKIENKKQPTYATTYANKQSYPIKSNYSSNIQQNYKPAKQNYSPINYDKSTVNYQSSYPIKSNYSSNLPKNYSVNKSNYQMPANPVGKPVQNYSLPNEYNKPTTNYQSQQQTYSSPKEYNKPTTNYQSQQQTYSSPKEYNKPTTNYQQPPPPPPQQTYSPTKEYNKPTTNYQPQVQLNQTYSPPKEYNKPTTNYQPPPQQQTYSQPKEYNKPTTNYQSQQQTYSSPKEYNKPTTNYQQPPPPQQTYSPPKEYNKPTTNYQPPPQQQTYSPPKEYNKPTNYQPQVQVNQTKPMVYQNPKPHSSYSSAQQTIAVNQQNYASKPSVEYKPNNNYNENYKTTLNVEKPANSYDYYTNNKSKSYITPLIQSTYSNYTKPLIKNDYANYTYPLTKQNYPENKNKYLNVQQQHAYQNYPPSAAVNYSKPVYPNNNDYNRNNYNHHNYIPAVKPIYKPSNNINYNQQLNSKNRYTAAPIYPQQPNYEYQQYQWANENYKEPIVFDGELGNRFYQPNSREYKLMKTKKLQNELKWRLAYDLNSEYSIAKSTPYDWANLVNLLRTDNALFERYYRNLHRQSSALRWKIECNELCRQHILDEIIVIDPLEY